MSFIHALKWSFLSEIAAKAIQPIVFIVLARLLTPEDFGVMSAALMVITFSQIFWEAGMGKTLIQRQSEVEKAANITFWINVILGVAISIIILIAAAPIARTFFHDTRVTHVIQIMTLQILMAAISSVHMALLQKAMDYKKLFLVRITTLALPGLVSIILAWEGMGYWSLIIGALAGQLIQMALLWRINYWRPIMVFDSRLATDLWGFSKWVLLTGVCTWIVSWADTLFLGYYFSVNEVGLFRFGNQATVMIFSLIFSFANPVLYSKFSSMGGDRELIKNRLLSTFPLISSVALPLGLVVVGTSNMIELALGDKWKGIALIIALVGIKEAANWIWGYYQEACRAMGKPGVETFDAIVSGLIHIGVLYYYRKETFEEFVYGRSIIIGSLAFILHLAVILYIYRKLELAITRAIRHVLVWLIILYIISGSFMDTRNVDMTLLVTCICLYSMYILASEKNSLRTLIMHYELTEQKIIRRN